jgi:hypothetical protein
MTIISQGSDPEEYSQFLSMLKKALTGDPKLATVLNSEAPLTDQAWTNIGEANGNPGIYAVLGTFLSFFFDRLQSSLASGSDKSTTSASHTRAA